MEKKKKKTKSSHGPNLNHCLMTYVGESEQMTLRGEIGNGWRGDASSNTALLLRQRFTKEGKPQGDVRASKSGSRNLGAVSIFLVPGWSPSLKEDVLQTIL